jgi:host factor-I protein
VFPGNIQETFFDSALHGKKHVTVHLLNGVKLSGKVRSFDKYAVVLESGSLEQLIFKHSISAAFVCRNRHCAECFPGGNNERPVPAASSKIDKN